MNNNPVQHIGEIINSYFQNRSWAHRIEGYSVLKIWDDIIPKNISVNIRPIKIQDHFLFLKAKNHIWAHELKIRKGEIIHLINQRIGKELIQDVLVKIDHRSFNDKVYIDHSK